MKKIISVLLAISMLLAVLSFGTAVYAGEGSATVNMDCRSITMPRLFAVPVSQKKTFKGATYYSEGKELYNIIRKAADNRKDSVKVKYYSKKGFQNRNDLLDKITEMVYFSLSDEMSVSSTDGDYALWNLDSTNMQYSELYSSDGHFYDIKVTFYYYNTPEQEKAVDNEINKIVSYIRKQDWSDYQIVRYVHDYVCRTTNYCYDALDDMEGYPTAFTAYGALVDNTCVCQGYALAFYRICRELGYDVRFVYSYVHAWNIIRLDSKTYFVDCTWDDSSFVESNDATDDDWYYYFLVNSKTIKSHDSIFDSYQSHSIAREQSSDDYFISKYLNKLSTTNYNLNTPNQLSRCSIKLSGVTFAHTGKAITPNVSIKDENGTSLVNGVDYRVSFSSNTNCGRGVVTITGLGRYAGAVSRRTFVIKPRAVSKPALYTNGRTSNSIHIRWSKPSGSVDGYQVQMIKNGAWTNVKTITTSSTTDYTIDSLTANKKCQFRIRAFKNIGRVKYYGDYSNIYTTYTSPVTPSLTLLSTKSKSITAKWKKVTATGYEVQYSTDKAMKNAKMLKTSSKTVSRNIKSLKKGKRYYIRVRAYRNVTTNGKTNTYHSKWSAKKSIVVK